MQFPARGRGVLAVALLAAALPACARRRPAPDALTLSVPYELETLDPHARNRLSNFAVASHFYEPLVTTDRNMAIHPCLATRWDNPDLLTWVFHLRPGVRFHGGRPLRAADVVFTFERLLASRDLAMAGYVQNIRSVREIDPMTVEIRTGTPMSILLNKLRFVLVVPAGASGLATRVDGTGPYRLTGFDRDREVRMRRNDAFWGERPAMREVTFRLARSPEQALADLAQGRSDFVQANSRAAEDVVRRLPGVVMAKENGIFVKFLSFDLARDVPPVCPAPKNPFRSRAVREAIGLAIDRHALVARLRTFAIPAWQSVPPSIFGYNPQLPEPPTDPPRARRILAEAGYPNGFTVTLHARRLFDDAVPPVVEMLAAVGVTVVPHLLTDPEYFDVVSTRHESCFFLSRFGCPTGDISDILDNAMHSRDERRHLGAQNDANYSSPALDRKIEESASTLDMERRRPLLTQIIADLSSELVWIPLYIEQNVFLHRDRLSFRPRADEFVLAAEIGNARPPGPS